MMVAYCVVELLIKMSGQIDLQIGSKVWFLWEENEFFMKRSSMDLCMQINMNYNEER